MRENNHTFNEMEAVALERLKGMDPKEISQKTTIPFDEESSAIYLNSLGIDVTIHYPAYTIEPYLPDWHHLILLHHLEMAQGVGISKNNISFRELPDGFVRGEQFDKLCETIVARTIGNFELKGLTDACLAMGAKIQESRADLSAEFSFAPLYPVTLNLWLAEEDELPGSGKMLLDSNAAKQLSTEDAVTIGELILETIKTKYKEKS